MAETDLKLHRCIERSLKSYLRTTFQIDKAYPRTCDFLRAYRSSGICGLQLPTSVVCCTVYVEQNAWPSVKPIQAYCNSNSDVIHSTFIFISLSATIWTGPELLHYLFFFYLYNSLAFKLIHLKLNVKM